MTESIVVITSTRLDADALAEAYSVLGKTHVHRDFSFGPRIVVEYRETTIFMDIDDIFGDFEPEELELILERLTDPHCAGIHAHSLEAFNAMIEYLPAGEDTLIDNDHGMIAPLPEVRSLIRDGVVWIPSFEVVRHQALEQ